MDKRTYTPKHIGGFSGLMPTQTVSKAMCIITRDNQDNSQATISIRETTRGSDSLPKLRMYQVTYFTFIDKNLKFNIVNYYMVDINKFY